MRPTAMRRMRWTLLVGVVASGLLVGWGTRRQLMRAQAPAASRPASGGGHAPAVELARRVPPAAVPGPPTQPEVGHVPGPRAADEWQGMPVDLAHQPECATSETCGLAMACVDGRCGPCTSDGQCQADERCALDHCVRQEQLGCRSRADCSAGELCVLSGYSPGTRGNASMAARCLGLTGGGDPEEVPPADPAPAKEIGDSIAPSALLDSLDPPE